MIKTLENVANMIANRRNSIDLELDDPHTEGYRAGLFAAEDDIRLMIESLKNDE